MNSWKVPKSESGTKLVHFLKERLPDSYSGRKIKQLIESSSCRVNGRVENFASKKVKTGDLIECVIKETSSVCFDQNDLLFEDDDFIIYNKPAGVACDAEGIGSFFPETDLIHRLDRDTTGVLLLAKNDQTLKAMIESFRQKEVEKIYLAIVDGIPQKSDGVIENHLARLQSRGKIQWGQQEDGQFARTDWKLLQKGRQASLIECRPITGRTHQIRVHLKDLGHAVLGDYQYQRNFRCKFHADRTFLHASEITFMHPGTKEKMHFHVELPNDMQAAMKELFE